MRSTRSAARTGERVASLLVIASLFVAASASALDPDPDRVASRDELAAIADWTPSATGEILGPVHPWPVNERERFESVMLGLDMRDDGYNSAYIFGMTRGVGASTMHPAIKPLFFLITIPLDIVFLPFAAIGGFF
jgi:hypothetical protein